MRDQRAFRHQKSLRFVMENPTNEVLLLNRLSLPKSSTNIEEVKRLNAQSGLSYNQVFELLAEKYRQETAQKSETNTF